MGINMIPFRIVCLTLVVIAATLPAAAQNKSPAELAAYQGADRTARLIEGAKREGTLSLYTSRVAEDTNPVIDAFSKNMESMFPSGGPPTAPCSNVSCRNVAPADVPPMWFPPAPRRSNRCIASKCSPP